MLFITPNLATIFVVNYKCGYSTFRSLVSDQRMFIVNFEEGTYYNDEGKKHSFDKNKVVYYATMRDPYRRLLSFYNDKFINCFLPGSDEAGKQTCHQAMFDFFDESKIRALEFTFSDLIGAIKRGYDDVHLYPQSDIIHHFKLGAQRVINIDRSDFNDQCKIILGFDMPVRNKSIRPGSQSRYARIDTIGQGAKEFIRDKYRNDFKLLQMLR